VRATRTRVHRQLASLVEWKLCLQVSYTDIQSMNTSEQIQMRSRLNCTNSYDWYKLQVYQCMSVHVHHKAWRMSAASDSSVSKSCPSRPARCLWAIDHILQLRGNVKANLHSLWLRKRKHNRKYRADGTL